jgi:hypothetical protein
MAVLQWTLVLFLAALLVHLLIWRLRKPGSPLKALLAIFFAVAAAGLAGLHFGEGVLASAGLAVLPGPAAYLHVLTCFIPMALAYTINYTLLEWDSPTLTIVTMIENAGERGLAEAELVRLADNLPFIQSRIRSLVSDKIIAEDGGRYVVSPGRHFCYRFILFYHRLLKTDTRRG